MWELVSFMGGFVVFVILMLVLLLTVTNINTVSEWIAKRVQCKLTPNEFETRLKALENRLDRIEAKVRTESVINTSQSSTKANFSTSFKGREK